MLNIYVSDTLLQPTVSMDILNFILKCNVHATSVKYIGISKNGYLILILVK